MRRFNFYPPEFNRRQEDSEIYYYYYYCVIAEVLLAMSSRFIAGKLEIEVNVLKKELQTAVFCFFFAPADEVGERSLS